MAGLLTSRIAVGRQRASLGQDLVLQRAFTPASGDGVAFQPVSNLRPATLDLWLCFVWSQIELLDVWESTHDSDGLPAGYRVATLDDGLLQFDKLVFIVTREKFDFSQLLETYAGTFRLGQKLPDGGTYVRRM